MFFETLMQSKWNAVNPCKPCDRFAMSEGYSQRRSWHEPRQYTKEDLQLKSVAFRLNRTQFHHLELRCSDCRCSPFIHLYIILIHHDLLYIIWLRAVWLFSTNPNFGEVSSLKESHASFTYLHFTRKQPRLAFTPNRSWTAFPDMFPAFYDVQ